MNKNTAVSRQITNIQQL